VIRVPGALNQKKPPSTQRAQSAVFSAIFALSAVFSGVACGKKGPPLAPLIKLPVPPADLAALRRGNTVDVSFTVPAVNTDGTRPANVASADIYAITVPVTVPPLSDTVLLKLATKVGSVEVKAPSDPNETADADDPSDEVDAPEGPGLDQGAFARVKEPLTRDMLTPVAVPIDKHAPTAPADARSGAPLLGPQVVPVRTYVAVGTSTRGRKGPVSKRITVPLVPPPLPPSGAKITYDETAIALTWAPVAAAVAAPAEGGLLPSRVVGAPRPTIAYNVYDATNPDAVVKLNATPLADPTYSDARVVWGEKRCYTIVAAEAIDGTVIESEPPPPACETLVDTFPPAVPKELKAISGEGAINLIWEPNTEKDLAGYIVLRGVEAAATLQPITPAPIVEPSFTDKVQPGLAYVYAVRAVDRAGNVSDLSARVVDTAR
jgi:predicted small lipoprotein YifL